MAVDLVPSSSGVESMQLLASGQVEVAFAGVTAALFNAVQRGVPIKLTVTTDVYYPAPVRCS